MNTKLIFLSNFLKKPKEVAALTPSSKYVINQIVKNIDFDNARYIVEYGPGIGTITKAILQNLNHDAKLLCFELNKKFCKYLNNKLADPRLIVINDTVEKLDLYLNKYKIKNVDYVFSGIPFSLMKKENKELIVKKTRDSLREGGKFIVYQYSQHMKKYLKKYFDKISTDLELRNVPPNFIFVCEKI